MSDLSHLNFDADQEEVIDYSQPPPEGQYVVAIENREWTPTKAGHDMLVLTLVIKQGPQSDRPVYLNLNLNHPNSKANQIARSNLAAICKAVGVPRPKDTEDLMCLEFLCDVYHEEFNGRTYARARKFQKLAGAKKAEKKHHDVDTMDDLPF